MPGGKRVGSAVVHGVSCNRKIQRVDHVPIGKGGYKRFKIVPRPPHVAQTYVSIKNSCPPCEFKEDGSCYAMAGFTGAAVRLLDQRGAESVALDRDAPMREEAKALDGVYVRGVPQRGGRCGTKGMDLRLHVSGDVTSRRGVAILVKAVYRYKLRGGGQAWLYTKRWREVPRGDWGPINVLASVETPKAFAEAVKLGYVSAVTLPDIGGDRAVGAEFYQVESGLEDWKLVPCPAEQKDDVTCVSCRLCVERDLFKLKIAIAFELHGPPGGPHEKALVQLRLPSVEVKSV